MVGRWRTDTAGNLVAEPEIVLNLSAGAASAEHSIQIASDLHLEFVRPGCGAELDLDEVIVPAAPVLALLGDIGIPSHPLYREFLLRQAERFEAVLVLTGNHEFYSLRRQPASGATQPTCIDDVEGQIEAICAEHPRLHYVDNRCVRLGAAVDAPALLCTPLWSHVPDDAMQEVGRCLNDYRMCYIKEGVGRRKLQPRDTSRWHALAVEWIRAEILRLCGAHNPDEKASACSAVAVLSHHTPCMHGTSDPKFEGANATAVQHGFSSDLVALYSAVEPLTLWAYGHTHFNNDRIHSGTRLVSNQRGYMHERDRRYRPDLCLALRKS